MADALTPPPQAPDTEAFSAFGAASAVAGAIPAMVSMLQVTRTVTTAPIAENDLAAAAAIMEGIRDQWTNLIHEQFRIVPKGQTFKRVGELLRRRGQLLASVESRDEAGKANVKDVIQAIDNFITSLSAPLSSGANSLLHRAMLFDQLYEELSATGADFTHALLVKSQGGRGQQVISDLPLWSKDKLFLMAEVALTFILVETSTGAVCLSGTAAGQAQAHYDIGGAGPEKKRSFFGRS